MANLFFFTGTDTDIGKTYCAAKVAEMLRRSGRRVGVYKPVASGCEVMPDGRRDSVDASTLWHAAGCPRTLDDVCPQRFLAALSPPRAAAAEGRQVDEIKLLEGVKCWCDGSSEVVLVEGAGGLFSPISDHALNVDFAKSIRDWAAENGHSFRVILVVPDRLGMLHQTLATTLASVLAGLTIDGILTNQLDSTSDLSCQTNADDLAIWCPVPIVASVRVRNGDCETRGNNNSFL